MFNQDDKSMYSPFPGWQAEEWLAAQPYCRGMVGSIVVTVLLGLVHLFIGLPAAAYFGIGLPLLLIYYHCLTRLKKLVRQVKFRRAQSQQHSPKRTARS